MHGMSGGSRGAVGSRMQAAPAVRAPVRAPIEEDDYEIEFSDVDDDIVIEAAPAARATNATAARPKTSGKPPPVPNRPGAHRGPGSSMPPPGPARPHTSGKERAPAPTSRFGSASANVYDISDLDGAEVDFSGGSVRAHSISMSMDSADIEFSGDESLSGRGVGSRKLGGSTAMSRPGAHTTPARGPGVGKHVTMGGASSKGPARAGGAKGKAATQARQASLSFSMSDVGDLEGDSLGSAELSFGSEDESPRPAPTMARAGARGAAPVKGGPRAGPRGSMPDAEIMNLDGPPVLTHVKSKGRQEPKVESFSIEFSDQEGSSVGSDLVIEHSQPELGAGALSGRPGFQSRVSAPSTRPPDSGAHMRSSAARQQLQHSSSIDISGNMSDLEGSIGEEEGEEDDGPSKQKRLSGPSGGRTSDRSIPAATGPLLTASLTAMPAARMPIAAIPRTAPARAPAAPVRRLSRTPDTTPDISGTSEEESEREHAGVAARRRSSGSSVSRGRAASSNASSAYRPQVRGVGELLAESSDDLLQGMMAVPMRHTPSDSSRSRSRSHSRSRSYHSRSRSTSSEGRPHIMTLDALQPAESPQGSISSSSDQRPRLMTLDALEAADSVSGSPTRSTSSRSSTDHKPRLMTVDALERLSDGYSVPVSDSATSSDHKPRLMTLDALQAADSHSRSSKATSSSSSSSSDHLPRIMTVDALQAADFSALSPPMFSLPSHSHSRASSNSSDDRPRIMTLDALQAADSAPSSPSSFSSDARPRIMTLDALQEVSADAFPPSHGKQPAVGGRTGRDASGQGMGGGHARGEEEDEEDPLAGLVMVRAQASPSGSSSSGTHDSRALYVIHEGSSSSAMSREPSVTAPDSPRGALGGVVNRSPSRLRVAAGLHPHGSGSGSGSGDEVGTEGEGGMTASFSVDGRPSDHGLSASSDALGGALGGVAPGWRMAPPGQGDGGVSAVGSSRMGGVGGAGQGLPRGARVEEVVVGGGGGHGVGPTFPVIFRPIPAPSGGSGGGGGGSTGNAPPAVFGRQSSFPMGSHGEGSTGGSGRLASMAAGTQTDPTANVVDLTPLGSAARGHPPVRTVALQVGSMNEVSTQVVFDDGQDRLLEGTAGGLQAAAGLGGLGTDVAMLLPPGSSTAAHLKTAQQAAQHGNVMQFFTEESLMRGGGTGGTGSTWPYTTQSGATGSGVGGSSKSLSGLAALQSLLTQQNIGASTGTLMGSGWGVLSMAAQNMKAAHLIEQVERTAQHLQALAAIAATNNADTTASLNTGTHKGPHIFGPTLAASGADAGTPPPPVSPHVAASGPASPYGRTAPQQHLPHADGTRPATATSSGRPTSHSIGAGASPGPVHQAQHSRVLSGGGLASTPAIRSTSAMNAAVTQPHAQPDGRLSVGGGGGAGAWGEGSVAQRKPSAGQHMSTALSEVYSEEFEEEQEEEGRGGMSGGNSSIRTEIHGGQGSEEGFAEEEVVGSESQSPVGGQSYHSARHTHHSVHKGPGVYGGVSGRRTSGSSMPFTEEALSGSYVQARRTLDTSAYSNTQDFTTFASSQHQPSTTFGGNPSGGARGSRSGTGTPPPIAGSHGGAATTSTGGRRISGSHMGESIHARRPSIDGSSVIGPLPGDLRAVSRRASIAGASGLSGPAAAAAVAAAAEHGHKSISEAVRAQAPLIPDHNVMEPLPGPQGLQAPRGLNFMGAPAGAGGGGRSMSPSTSQKERTAASSSGAKTLTGMLASPGRGGDVHRHGQSRQQQDVQQQPMHSGSGKYQGTGNAAQDTLLRYAALLSSEALPGGLMDPAALCRLRGELLAGAAAAAASGGMGYADVVAEAGGDLSLRLQVARLRSKLSGVRGIGSLSPASTLYQGALSTGTLLTGSTGGWLGMTGSSGMASSTGGVRGVSRDREVVVDKATGRLVDVGASGSGGYQYTTLQDTMAFIRAYRPAGATR